MVDAYREKCVLDIAGQLHTRTHRGCDTAHRPAQARARPDPITEKSHGQEVPPLSEELVITDNCRKRETELSLSVWPPVR